MSMEEIEKLRARVEKDPNSRLFLPLAEEYRKLGMQDEAISVILGGLERQPAYTSAHVALGRIYLEKNMVEEAKKEFEAVVRAIPDNLFAHRKLADIYRDRGETEKAIAEYEIVVKLNPIDEDAKMCLAEIMGGLRSDAELYGVYDARKDEGIQEVLEEPTTIDHDIDEGTSVSKVKDRSGEVMETLKAEPREECVDEFDEFKRSFAGRDAETAQDVLEIPEDLVFDLQEEQSAFSGSGNESLANADSHDVAAVSVNPEAVPNLSAADSFIRLGNYYGALETYKEILATDPGNKQVLQRTAELKALMKLTGKDCEVLIGRLEAFLDAVKRGFPKKL